MNLPLHKTLLLSLLFALFMQAFTATTFAGKPDPFFKRKTFFGGDRKDDSVAAPVNKTGKICSCQILELQSTNHHHRNFAVLAEKTNGKSFFSDLNKMNRTLEREKKHIRYFFYDKLTVVNAVTEATDCRSLYSKLKFKNRSLMLYDILDADIRK